MRLTRPMLKALTTLARERGVCEMRALLRMAAVRGCTLEALERVGAVSIERVPGLDGLCEMDAMVVITSRGEAKLVKAPRKQRPVGCKRRAGVSKSALVDPKHKARL